MPIPMSDVEWYGVAGKNVLLLAHVEPIMRTIRKENEPLIFGDGKGQLARVVIQQKAKNLNLVPVESWAGLAPSDIWSWGKSHHIRPRMTLAATARAAMQKAHAKAYEWSSQESWIEAAKTFYHAPKRGPLMVGRDVVIPDGIQLDIRGAYLWAMRQGLPCGTPRSLSGYASDVPEGFDGFFQGEGPAPWYGTVGERRTLDRLQQVRTKGRMTLWSLKAVPIPFEYDEIGKPLYQRAWVRHMPYFMVGRRFSGAPQPGEVPDMSGSILWHKVAPERGNPEVTAIIAGRVRSRLHEILYLAEDKKLATANVIVDSILADRAIIPHICIGADVGDWRVAKEGKVVGTKTPTLYRVEER